YKRLIIKYKNINNPEEYFLFFENLSIKEEEKIKKEFKESFEKRFDLDELFDFLKYSLLKKKDDPEKTADQIIKYASNYSDNLINNYTLLELLSKVDHTDDKNNTDQFYRFWLELLKQKKEWEKAKNFIIDYLKSARNPWTLYYFLVSLIDLMEEGYLKEDEIEIINNKLGGIKKKNDPLIKEALILWYNKIDK
ncbi:MAG: hypothetical protein ABR596_05510, partial [Halarsenatibacteraceae bacterium]